MSNSEASWEVKYKEYLEEEPIIKKIKRIEKSIKDKAKRREAKIEKLESEKVVGNFKTKEEYETAVEAHKKQIDDIKKEKAEIEASLENDEKLQEYRNFENNKDKIRNIYEYRNELIKKLENLPIDTGVKIEDIKQEREARLLRIGQYQVEVEELNAQLSENKNLTDEQRQIMSLEMRTKKDEVKRLCSEQVKAAIQIENLEKIDTKPNENTLVKKEEYQRKIAKCNVLAVNLLNGKNIDDIELNVEQAGKKLTAKNKESKNILATAREENQEDLGIRKGKPTSIYNPEQEAKKAEETKTDKENKELVKVSKFAEKHPKLAKFFRSIKNWFISEEEYEIEDNTNKEIGDEVSKMLKDKKQLEREDFLLKQIAREGKEKTFRDMIKVNATREANRLAEKHGGAYEKQDGATSKKVEKEVIR